jgi:hypothetical protein
MAVLDYHADKWAPEPNTGCYLWTGAVSSSGNGLARRADRPSAGWNGKIVRVARIVCEETHGPPPTPKHHAAHATSNGCVGGVCVNGAHLRWATARENAADISVEMRSDRIRRGAINIPMEVKRERSRRANNARWNKN